MNHLPAILSLALALAIGYLALMLESKSVRQQTTIEKLTRELDALKTKEEETAKTTQFLDDQIFALKEDKKPDVAGVLGSEALTGSPPYITRSQLESALSEHMLIIDEKLKPIMTRPLELKIWDMANPTAEVTPLVPPPEADKGAKK
ncbi:MAG: hypothetical protein ACAI34_06225 [Verrucomicrobium sp.]